MAAMLIFLVGVAIVVAIPSHALYQHLNRYKIAERKAAKTRLHDHLADLDHDLDECATLEGAWVRMHDTGLSDFTEAAYREIMETA